MKVRSTTIITVRHKGEVAVAGDGQVSLGNTVMKHQAKKVRRLYHGKVITGFAGATADAFNASKTTFGPESKSLDAQKTNSALNKNLNNTTVI